MTDPWVSPHMTGLFRPEGRFDEKRAASAMREIEALPNVKGRQWSGQNVRLLPWQRQLVEDVFGVIDEDGYRQYKTVYVEIPKKNGKSTLAAAIGLQLFFNDGEPGAEVYCAAHDKDQAAIVYKIISAMVKRRKEYNNRVRIQDYRYRMIKKHDGAELQAVERDAASQHGYDIHGLIFDELHTQRTSELWDTLSEGTIARKQPLTFVITTAGFDRTSPCWRLHQYARSVMANPSMDPTFYPVIYSAADDDEWEAFDWLDEERWFRANPSMDPHREQRILGIAVEEEQPPLLDIDEMRQRVIKAQEIPTEQNTVKRLRQNIWTQAETRFLSGAAWDECGGIVHEEDLYGKRAYGALDMASTTDVAAWITLVPTNDGLAIFPRFWIPQDTIRKRSKDDGVPYEFWAKRGLVNATPGNSIEYDQVEKDIKDLTERFNFRCAAYDEWNAEHMAQRLADHGLEMVKFPQRAPYFNQPTRALLKLVLDRQLMHGGHPVLRWMMDNLVVTEDSNSNIRPNKAKATEKIDGMVALIMAIDMWMRYSGDGREPGDIGITVGSYG